MYAFTSFSRLFCKRSPDTPLLWTFSHCHFIFKRVFNSCSNTWQQGIMWRKIQRSKSCLEVTYLHVSHFKGFMSTIARKEKQVERILITGISGRFPSCRNIAEFHEKLRSGTDMVGDQTRWETFKLGPRFGAMPELDRFDADFFCILPTMAENMEVQQRQLLEVSFESIVDAGFNPEELAGKAVGVFVAGSTRDCLEYNCLNGIEKESHSLLGVSEFMIPGRIAHSLDLRGPLLTVNSGCSSSLVALQQAFGSIRQGFCEAAIVAAAQISLNPSDTLALASLGALSPDGKCKTFDDSANGYVRSEAVVAILIQKESFARRHYATIRSIGSSGNGKSAEGIMFPSATGQEALLRQVYTYSGIDPASVSYVEAHGTGTAAGDPQEVEAIYNVLCKGVPRKQPLLLGSVKTNIGHTEIAAGLCGIAKVLLCIQDGIIPANLHFKQPNQAFAHLLEESLEIVKTRTRWPRGLVGISSFGLNGNNAHVVLEPGPISPPDESTYSSLPILITMQGRSEVGLTNAIEEVLRLKPERPFIHLLRQGLGRRIPGFDCRGFGLSGQKSKSDPEVVVSRVDTNKLPDLWFIYPGMGSQWTGMGKDLMRFQAFAASINSSQVTLARLGIDLHKLLWSESDIMYKDIRMSHTAIAAVQIALHDLLTTVGLVPAGYVGHSAGEILCAYADGCCDHEEALLVAEARGRALKEITKEPLSVAAIALSWEAAEKLCPSGVYPSCNNGQHAVTIAGPQHLIQETVTNLKCQGVFGYEVATCGTAPHSTYVQSAVPLLLEYTREVLGPRARPRSLKWISSSVVMKGEQPEGWMMSASAEYFSYTLANSVRFYEATQQIPPGALVVEVSPCDAFHNLMRQNLPSCTHVAPMSSNAESKVEYFLRSLGSAYNLGLHLNLATLYGNEETKSSPAPANIPCISPLVTWNHEDSLPTFIQDYPAWSQRRTVVDLKDPVWKYLEGHKVGKSILFPATAYLTLAWKHLADIQGIPVEFFPVIFRDVAFERATVLKANTKTSFGFQVNHSGNFTITESDTVVCTGQMETISCNATVQAITIEGTTDEVGTAALAMHEVYQELRLRGYNPQGEFRSVFQLSIDGKHGQIIWTSNWTTFLDSLLQTVLLNTTTARKLLVPTGVREMRIMPQFLLQHTKTSVSCKVPVLWQRYREAAVCPGVEAVGITWASMNAAEDNAAVSFCRHLFSPYLIPNGVEPTAATHHGFYKLATVVSENVHGPELLVLQVCNALDATMTKALYKALVDMSAKSVKYTLMSSENSSEPRHEGEEGIEHKTRRDCLQTSSPHLLILGPDPHSCEITSAMKYGSFFLMPRGDFEVELDKELIFVAEIQVESDSINCYQLLRKVRHVNTMEIGHVKIIGASFVWLTDLQKEMKKPRSSKRRIWITSQNETTCGILGLVRCLRAEQEGEPIRAVFDPSSSLGDINFSQPGSLLRDIVARDMAVNIVKNTLAIGTYCHVPAPTETVVTDGSKDFHLCVLRPGDLGSLTWVESPVLMAQSQGEPCRVAYTAINFKDVMVATGRLPLVSQDGSLGYEFSGYDSKGNRVMGIVPFRGIATSVIADPSYLWSVPDSWSLEDAATPMLAFLTAYYSLCIRGGLSETQSVLIHSGAGGVGLAAIHVALSNRCRVFTTVGNADKRYYLRQQFPQLQEEDIYSSRNTSFEDQIKNLTDGTGVDLVLNSLVGDLEPASVRVIAPNGHFLQIAAPGASHMSKYPMDLIRKNICIHGIALDQLFSGEKIKLPARALTEAGLRAGVVKPLPRTVFPAEQVGEAIRFMMTGKHVGKIVLDMRDQVQWDRKESEDYSEGHCARFSPPLTTRVSRKVYFRPDRSYVIVGGLGALGLETANWLITRGARHLILPSRSGVTTGYQALCLHKWKEHGVSVETPTIDLSLRPQVADQFVKELNRRIPIGGIFNSALVLKDGPIETQTEESFHAVAAPKIGITRNLDSATRKLCDELDHFVVFSSMVAGRGYDSQSNYGYGNDAMERIIESRVADGLHGLAVQWGPIADVGLMGRIFSGSRSQDQQNEFYGFVPQKVSSCMDALEQALLQRYPLISSFVSANKSSNRSRSARQQFWSSLRSIFGNKDLSKLEPKTILSSLGVDSLTIVELRQLLMRDFSYPVTVNQLKAFTIGDLINIGELSCNRPSSLSTDPMQSTPMFSLHEDSIVRLAGFVGAITNVPLFLVHGNDGSAQVFKGLASRISCPTYGFQFGKYAQLGSINELAKAYIQEMRRIHPHGPYRLGGFSGGGTIAFEMATLLEEDAPAMVEDLFFLEATCDFTRRRLDQRKAFKAYLNASGLLYHIAREDRERLILSLDNDVQRCAQALETFFLNHPSHFATELVKAARQCLRHWILTLTYVPSKTFNTGRAHLIKAEEAHFISDETYNLEPYCKGGLSCHTVRGNHYGFLSDQFVNEVATIINSVIGADTI